MTVQAKAEIGSGRLGDTHEPGPYVGTVQSFVLSLIRDLMISYCAEEKLWWFRRRRDVRMNGGRCRAVPHLPQSFQDRATPRGSCVSHCIH
jgi:hypothetical protein